MKNIPLDSSPAAGPATADDIFEIDDEALSRFIDQIIADYGPLLQDLDPEGLDLASSGLAHLVEEAGRSGVIRPPAGMPASAIQVSPLAGRGVFGLVMLGLGRSGLSISRWPIEINANLMSLFTGAQPHEDLRNSLEDVLDEANELLPSARALAPHLPQDEADDEDS